MSLALAVALTLVAQGPRPTPQTLDPFLPEALRPVVEQAAQAERDPRRGPGNAMSTLKTAKEGLRDPAQQLTLDLRVAGIVLRQRFLSDQKFPEPTRWEQVLSTFARLDLTEPLLSVWLEDAIAHHPVAKQNLAKKANRRLKIALLLRGEAIDKARAQAVFTEPITALGYRVDWVAPKEADFVIKLGAQDATSNQAGQRAVRVLLGIESLRDGKLVWSHSLFRTEQAQDPAVALNSALQWMGRIGGRDLFFHWLAEKGFGMLQDAVGVPAGADDHRGDGHGH